MVLDLHFVPLNNDFRCVHGSIELVPAHASSGAEAIPSTHSIGFSKQRRSTERGKIGRVDRAMAAPNQSVHTSSELAKDRRLFLNFN
jgi:hypothetical protein